MIVFMDVNLIGAILISQSDRARLVAILGLVGQGEVSYYVITTCAVSLEGVCRLNRKINTTKF